MPFRVIGIIDGDTIIVSPAWQCFGMRGDGIRPTGYNAPELGMSDFFSAKDKLAKIVGQKDVELVNAMALSYDRLVCDVIINGRNLAEYFPEYR